MFWNKLPALQVQVSYAKPTKGKFERQHTCISEGGPASATESPDGRSTIVLWTSPHLLELVANAWPALAMPAAPGRPEASTRVGPPETCGFEAETCEVGSDVVLGGYRGCMPSEDGT